MALPLRGSIDDIRAIVAYLRNKPTGATLDEVKAALGAKAVDVRKLSAYEYFGLVSREGERIKLTNSGWALARKPESEAEVFRAVIDRSVPYRSALEWMYHQSFEEVTFTDVASHWHEHHSAALGTTNEKSLKDSVGVFFNLAEAAGLGKLLHGGGRAHKPARFKIDRTALQKVVEAGPSAPPWNEGETESEELEPTDESVEVTEEVEEEAEDEAPPETPPVTPSPPEQLRVFIAHGKNMEIVEQVQTMLALADIEDEVAEEEETTAIPVPEKVFDAMRRCRAGIIVVSVDEGHKDDGNYTVNENVLIEIGAAFVLYERRVVLVWDKRLPVPSNLQGLYRCEFEGDELSWSAGMKLMKAIQQFKR